MRANRPPIGPLSLLAALLGACGGEVAASPDAGPPAVDAPALTADAPAATGDAPEDGNVAADAPEDPLALAAASPRRWTWVPVDGMRCLNNSPTGFGLSLSPESEGLVIFFMGGGACFNAQTCSSALHADGFNESGFRVESAVGGAVGPMARRDPNNPFRDWNYLYIGYCSGDVHAGDNPEGVVIEGTRYHFTGRRNVRLALQRALPALRGVRRVLVTGVSAGGFGAAYNYDQIATAFGPSVDVTLVDDSGPPLEDDQLAPCLQQTWRQLWNLNATLPADCTACRAQANGGGLVEMVNYLARKYPNRRMGLVSATGDDTIRNYFSWGRGGDCNRRVPMTREDFRAGLLALRRRTEGSLFRTYYLESNNHTWLLFPGWETTRVGGVPLNRWVESIALGTGTVEDIGPAAP